MALIYVVEDDKNIQEIETFALANVGYEVKGFDSAMDFYEALNDTTPDLILLDIMLPDEDGLSIVKKLRTRQDTVLVPVIMVTAKTTEIDKVKGLDLGADDYITKPFGTSELLARVRTAIRHARATVLTAEGMQTGQFRAGDLLIDYDKHRVYVGDRDVNLTQNEYKIVSLLGKYAGKVLTYDFIIKEIWGPNMQNDNRILRVNMANIRRKMENNPAQPQYIFTEVGVGYRIVDGD